MMNSKYDTRLGYYAKDSNDNLFQYEWGYDEVFYIMINGKKTIADPNEYEVLDISYSLVCPNHPIDYKD